MDFCFLSNAGYKGKMDSSRCFVDPQRSRGSSSNDQVWFGHFKNSLSLKNSNYKDFVYFSSVLYGNILILIFINSISCPR